MSKFILGGGIVGLITAYYNPEYIIVSDQIGGQMADMGLGPRILEVNENSTILLEDLGYDTVPVKHARIGYKVGDNYISHIDKTLRENYYRKSRFLSGNVIVPPSVMSDGKNVITYYDIDWNDLISRLMDGIQTIPIIGKVLNINIEKQTIIINEEGGPQEYEYESLVSTLPAPLYFKLAGLTPKEELTFVPKTFIIVPEFFDMMNFDYVYFPGLDAEYHRVTKLENGLVAIEYTTTKKSEDILAQWPEAINVKYLHAGQIQSGSLDFSGQENVYFIGRYACWMHDLKTDDVVFQALMLKELEDRNNGQ